MNTRMNEFLTSYVMIFVSINRSWLLLPNNKEFNLLEQLIQDTTSKLQAMYLQNLEIQLELAVKTFQTKDFPDQKLLKACGMLSDYSTTRWKLVTPPKREMNG